MERLEAKWGVQGLALETGCDSDLQLGSATRIFIQVRTGLEHRAGVEVQHDRLLHAQPSAGHLREAHEVAEREPAARRPAEPALAAPRLRLRVEGLRAGAAAPRALFTRRARASLRLTLAESLRENSLPPRKEQIQVRRG